MTTTFDILWDAPTSSRGRISFIPASHGRHRDSGITLHGLTHAKVTVLGWRTVPWFGLVIVLHEEGSNHWASRGERRYSPATVTSILVEGPEQYVPAHLNGTLSHRYVVLSPAVELPNAAGRADKTEQFTAFFTTERNTA